MEYLEYIFPNPTSSNPEFRSIPQTHPSWASFENATSFSGAAWVCAGEKGALLGEY